MDQEPHLQSSG